MRPPITPLLCARLICAPLLCAAALTAGCTEPEPAEVVVVPPTVALVAFERDGDRVEAVYDLANPNGFSVTVAALHLGLTADAASDATCAALTAGGCDGAAPGWPLDATLIRDPEAPAALTLAPRETTECHAALEDCRVIGDEFCCDNGDGCKPLGDCFGRVTPEGSRCLVCPTHAELRLRFALDAMPATLTARAAATFTAPELGSTLVEAPERAIPLQR